jgi:hypothetical protein
MDTLLVFLITMFAGYSDLMVGIHPPSPRYPPARASQETFLHRFNLKFAPSLIAQAEMIDLCGSSVGGIQGLRDGQIAMFTICTKF